MCSRFYGSVYNSITLLDTFTKMVPPSVGTYFCVLQYRECKLWLSGMMEGSP